VAEVWIKFCGCTSWSDVELAIDAGANAFGMIFAPSPRRIGLDVASEIARHLTPSIEPVAVFVNPEPSFVDEITALFPRARLQFSGDEPPDFVARYGDSAIKAIHVDSLGTLVAQQAAAFARATLLFDSRQDGLAGGTGTSFPWEHVVPIARERRVIVAGGLTPENVAPCVQRVHPFGVDVRTGIETGDRKDPEKMRAFVRAVREA
jgi:phosphoribosylanthranilate isomerase